MDTGGCVEKVNTFASSSNSAASVGQTENYRLYITNIEKDKYNPIYLQSYEFSTTLNAIIDQIFP